MTKMIMCIFILTVVVLISYGQITQMYFWRDDYTGLFFAQQANVFQDPAFAYPYHMAFIINKIAWQFFGLNAAGYFILEIVLYITAAWLLFIFLKKLFGDIFIAFCSSLIFAGGYIGQDAMKMTMGDGLGALVALNMLLISLLTFIIFLKNNKRIWLILTLITFFLTLEISPHRTSSSLIVFLALNLILSWKRRNVAFYLRNLVFISIFLIQYFLHPSVLLLGYKISSPTRFLGILLNFSPVYILTPLGTFWNLIVASDFQDKLNNIIGIPNQKLTYLKLWLAGLPSLTLIIIFSIFIKIIKPSAYNVVRIGKILLTIFLFFIVWSLVVFQINVDKYDLISIYNGGVFLLFLLIWIKIGIPKFKALSYFSLISIFAIIAIFLLTIPERILVSYNRYLLISSFTPAILPIIFVTREYFQKNSTKKNAARLLFLFFISILFLPRLWYALSTQHIFVNDYSRHSKQIYQQLKKYLPEVNNRKIIYIEGATRQLNFSVGDAARVGYLGSDGAFAVNYLTKKENFVLPETLDEIPEILKMNSELNNEDVFTFIYSEDGLYNTSAVTRRLLSNPPAPIILPARLWESDQNNTQTEQLFSIIPSSKVETLQPLSVKLKLRVLSKDYLPVSVLIKWQYNTYGLVHQTRETTMNLNGNYSWQSVIFSISAAGEYLKVLELYLPADLKNVELDDVTLSYKSSRGY